jgi:uncharacterized protein YndB with AHSA1/START domain
MSVTPVIVERTYNAPAEKVWSAITNPEEMKNWYFDLPGFKAELGYEFKFIGGSESGVTYLHLCKITEVIPGSKLIYSWRYDGYEGNSFVSFELFAEGEKTKLILTHSALETFPANNPDFAKHNFGAGWTHIIGLSLKKYVEQ